MRMNDFIYLYDGTFLNLLDTIAYLLEKKIKPLNIKNEITFAPSLFDETFKPILKKNQNIIDQIIHKISRDAFHTIYYVFLSEHEHKELIIYYFLLNGFKYGSKIMFLRNLKCVNQALKISQYVGRESHKLKGFIRFREINQTFLYAEMDPENNILSILSRHFAERLKNENWIIKDVKRNILSIYNKKEYQFIDGDDFKFLDFEIDETELEFERLWKVFFKTIAIEPRNNPRCQMNFMPKKYWKYIIEMSEKNEKSN